MLIGLGNNLRHIMAISDTQSVRSICVVCVWWMPSDWMRVVSDRVTDDCQHQILWHCIVPLFAYEFVFWFSRSNVYKLYSLELELDEIMPIIINAYHYMLAFFSLSLFLSHSTKWALNDGQSAPSPILKSVRGVLWVIFCATERLRMVLLLCKTARLCWLLAFLGAYAIWNDVRAVSLASDT